jgi:hypothetical protein
MRSWQRVVDYLFGDLATIGVDGMPKRMAAAFVLGSNRGISSVSVAPVNAASTAPECRRSCKRRSVGSLTRPVEVPLEGGRCQMPPVMGGEQRRVRLGRISGSAVL